MKQRPRTHVALVLDQSGSMYKSRNQAVDDYNEQVQQAKINAKDQDIFFSLVTFNSDVYEHLWAESVDQLVEANYEDYTTYGGTALRDAIAYTVGKLKKIADEDEEASFLVVVISDGQENQSKKYPRPQPQFDINGRLSKNMPDPLRIDLLDEVHKSPRWTISFMGCDESYLYQLHQETGIPLGHMAVWNNATPEMAALGLKNKSRKMSEYYGLRSKGLNLHDAGVGFYNTCSSAPADFTVDNDLDTTVGSVNVAEPPKVVSKNSGTSPFSNKSNPIVWS